MSGGVPVVVVILVFGAAHTPHLCSSTICHGVTHTPHMCFKCTWGV